MVTAGPPAWTRLVSAVLAACCAWIVAQQSVYAPAGYDHFTLKHVSWMILAASGGYIFGLFALTGRFTLGRPRASDGGGARTGSSAWMDYQKYVRRFLWVFLGGGVFVAGLTWLISLDSASLWLKMAPIMVWTVAWVALESPLRHFPCPRCKELFFVHSVHLWHWPFARSCLHCGLRKWEDWPA